MPPSQTEPKRYCCQTFFPPLPYPRGRTRNHRLENIRWDDASGNRQFARCVHQHGRLLVSPRDGEVENFVDGGSEMNENDIEHQLRQQPLARPSTDLDRRMDSLFGRAASESKRHARPAVPLWLAAAACLMCGLAGFSVRSIFISRRNQPAVIYIFPPSEAMTHLLNGTTASRSSDFDFSHAHAQVLQPPARQGNQL